jgi:hypothetical protein
VSLDNRSAQFHAIVVNESPDLKIEITAAFYLFGSENSCLSRANQKHGSSLLDGDVPSHIPAPFVTFIDCAAQYSESVRSAKSQHTIDKTNRKRNAPRLMCFG